MGFAPNISVRVLHKFNKVALGQANFFTISIYLRKFNIGIGQKAEDGAGCLHDITTQSQDLLFFWGEVMLLLPKKVFQEMTVDLKAFFLFHPWLYLVFLPAIAMRLWADEARGGTLELLMSLPAPAWAQNNWNTPTEPFHVIDNVWYVGTEGLSAFLFTTPEGHILLDGATPEGAPINHDPDNLIRTQDLPPYMEENSVCYLFTAESFAKTRARIGAKPILFETPRLESVDIDEKSDWFMAESLLMRVVAGETLPED